MDHRVHDAVTTFLNTDSYYPCLLLAHPQIHALETALGQLEAAYHWPHLSIGRELAAVLLAEPPAGRSQLARRWLETALGSAAPGPLLCTEIDLLFEPTLGLDALALLRQASRVTRLVIAWPGTYTGEILAYAAPSHRHYRTWRSPEAPVVALE